jgi:NADPH2:quinone reductase
MPDTMLAATIDGAVSIHRLRVVNGNPGEVLITVQTAGVGVWAAGIRRHTWDDTRSSLVLAFEGSGPVAAIGSGVRSPKVGDKDYGATGALRVALPKSMKLFRARIGVV